MRPGRWAVDRRFLRHAARLRDSVWQPPELGVVGSSPTRVANTALAFRKKWRRAKPRLSDCSRARECVGRQVGERPVRQVANGAPTIKLPIKVVPASSRDCIAGWLGDTLKVRVGAPAERGKANAAAERLVAEALGIPSKCA